MTAALTLPACALALGFTAFAIVALSMQRHRNDFIAPTAATSPATHQATAPILKHTTLAHLPPSAAQYSGYALLAASLWPCLLRWPPALAVMVWLGLLTVAGMALGLLLTYQPHRARHFIPAGAALSILTAAAAALGSG